jgi:Kef-type K+ transport system membrane component KefB
MTSIWALAALWLGLALIASLLSIWLRVSTALSEIIVGTIAQLIIGAAIGAAVLGTDETWVKVLSGTGAIVLTFLAGAELDPTVFRRKWKEATTVGLAGFFFPFFGCAAAAYFLLGWQVMPSWLAGVALSTTSVAVVYAVMLEFGLNKTEYGKTVLAACFINDLGTVLALGFIFAPFTMRTLIFAGVAVAVFAVLPWLTPRFFKLYGNRPSELETKFLLLCLFGLGALAAWADSEAVLPAYIIGMVLAGTVGKDHALIRRLRTLTFGFLTPFYFIRVGSFVSIPALCGRALCLRAVAAGQDADQVRRRLSHDQGLPVTTSGIDVHHAVDVDRAHFRHHLLPVRPVASHHRSEPIFRAGGRRDRQRRDPDLDRQRLLPAAPSPAAAGWRR